MYKRWTAMIQRCTNPKDKGFKDYGGRGITVCEQWRTSFEAFLKDLGEAPPGLMLDRIDNNGPYEPGNVKWSTPLESEHNKRRTGRLPKHLKHS